MKNLKDQLNEALNINEASLSVEYEKQVTAWAKTNDKSAKIKTVSIPKEYDEDIMDYLMEESESLVTDIDNSVLKMLKKVGITDSVEAFIHWTDEKDYSEYISYAY